MAIKLKLGAITLAKPKVSQVRSSRCGIHEMRDPNVWVHDRYSLWFFVKQGRGGRGMKL